MKSGVFLAAGALLGVALPVLSAETFTVAHANVAPKPNGVIRTHEYAQAATFRGAANYRFALLKNEKPAVDGRKTECAVTWDEDFLYLATRSETGPDGFLAKGGPRDGAWLSESVEFWFDPPKEIRRAEFAKFGTFQLTVSFDGKIHAMQHNPGFGLPARPWKLDGLKAKNAILGDFWDCEIAIPAAAFGAEKFDVGEWGMILGRNFRSNPAVQCTYAPFASSGAYTDPSSYARFALRRNVSPSRFNGAPELLAKGLPVPIPCNISARVRTTGVCPPKKYRRFFACQDLDGRGFPGGGEPGVECLAFRVTPRALGEAEILRDAQAGKGLSGEVRWYPSRSLLACEISFPKPASRAEFPELVLTDAKGRTVLKAPVPAKRESCVMTGGRHPMLIVHETVPVAEKGAYLPDGDYTVRLLAGSDRTVALEKKIRMKRYDWFKTSVGTADILLPGFTPVKADGRSVEVVGRCYVFAETGLPSEIWSLDRQILARPVALVNGRTVLRGTRADASAFSARVSASGTTASFSGSLASGRVEQDGFIVLDLDLPETRGDVALEIPVKAQFATLFHAVGEGTRGNPAGFVPKGAGRVFGSRLLTQTHVENFIPYCWVGTDTRGICYAADSDRGWEHAKTRDAVELLREPDGTVTMRLNLLNGEGPHAARRLTVTLMASPAKPMPKGWRGWVDAFDVPAERNALCNCSNPTWGCYIVGMARYPTFMEWKYVRKMREAAETGKVDKAYVEDWIARCLKAREERPELVPWLAKKPLEEAKRTLRAHAYSGLNRPCFLKDKKNRVLYYYTCDADPCTGLYELDVMSDEWGRATAVYGSHQDYAIYYLKRMCEEGMNGVYDDNSFFRCNYDWVAGDAWIDAKGEIRPSFSLWSLREFCRRQIVAMLEAGVKDPWLTIHHTNANILPTMSYATNTMGMEWKYGRSEYQDRYTRDYIRTVNQGLQAGCFPTSLEGIFDITDPAEKTRVTRTMLAALLPHEVQPTLQACGDHALVVRALTVKQRFGVGRDDCEYRAYWDGDNPVRQPREDVMVSTYRRGDRMLLVIGSYANEDVGLELALKAGEIVSARDAEDGRALSVRGGRAALALANRDFRLVDLTVK